ncbi:iron-siderophore ABC transporter substrate-binding protein [Pseudonocardia broussonetiae]|uniref:iron-siderophore ABC transporter substrate-binding protein n=1 Tax=Pseudonocardia broussonetiae TaxID=2736640 RepID=UPI001964EF44|nr:iron-siderophore ABC transporter substrate-binding protein [Pseudonocardia broussonetiae]
MITRRSLLTGAGALGLGAALAGCAGGTTAPPQASTRTITHKLGTTEISGTPQRVVTMGLTEQDYVLALGVTPVGVREWFGGRPGALWPWAAERADGVPEVLAVTEPSYEQVAALAPDLVLGVNYSMTPEEYATLSAIAPTVGPPVGHADYGAPWQVITEVVGTALGREEQAAALVAPVEQGFADLRSTIPAGRTGLLAARLEDGTYYAYAEGPAPAFLADLGLALPPAAEALFTGPDRPPVELSPEQLGVLDADVLVLGLYGAFATTGTVDDPVFGNLRVAREGRAILLPEQSTTNGALSFGSVLSLPVALAEMRPRLAAALDGDPATAVPPA